MEGWGAYLDPIPEPSTALLIGRGLAFMADLRAELKGRLLKKQPGTQQMISSAKERHPGAA